MDAVGFGDGAVGGFLVVEVVEDEGVFGVLRGDFLLFIGVLGGLPTEAAEEVGTDSPGGLRVWGFEISRNGQRVCKRGNGHDCSPFLKCDHLLEKSLSFWGIVFVRKILMMVGWLVYKRLICFPSDVFQCPCFPRKLNLLPSFLQKNLPWGEMIRVCVEVEKNIKNAASHFRIRTVYKGYN